MKRLYLYYLNLRVWLAHRHLRKIGFRKLIDEADARTLLQLAREDVDGRKLMLEWIKIGLMVIALLSLWLIFWLHTLEPASPVIVPLPEKSSPAPILPASPIYSI